MEIILNNNIKKYGITLNSQDVLKSIAILLMVIDHIGKFYYPDMVWFRVAGRMCIPIWFFFIGYSRLQAIDKPIIVGAVVLIVLDVLYNSPLFPFNILVTVMLCRLVHRYFLNQYLEKAGAYELFLLIGMVLLFYLPSMVLMEYGSLALLFTAFGRLLREQRYSRETQGFVLAAVITFTVLETNSFELSMLQSIVLFFGIALMMLVLYRYRLTHYSLSYTHPAAFGMMLLGRNTLYFYVIHWIILLSLDRLMHPQLYAHFKWVSN